MNRDKIIELAREAGSLKSEGHLGIALLWRFTPEELEHFAALVAEHEREMCAKVCEGLEHKLRNTSYTPNGFSCATAIRARGNE